jgi:hypothetical protein
MTSGFAQQAYGTYGWKSMALTKDQLDQIIQQNLDDGCAFPYLLTHCPRTLKLLDDLLKTGQATHEPMDWLKLGMVGNRDKAIVHLRKMLDKYNLDQSEDHWLNAVCRLLFVVEIREAAKEAASAQTPRE